MNNQLFYDAVKTTDSFQREIKWLTKSDKDKKEGNTACKHLNLPLKMIFFFCLCLFFKQDSQQHGL